MHSKSNSPTGNAGVEGKGEQGFALVLAILALMLLTFLGLTLATTTSTELQIATNYRWGQQALYNAEAGLDAGKVILASSIWGSDNWKPALPTARGALWFDNVSVPAPVETKVGRDYEKQTCDTKANMGYGRVFVAQTVRYETVSTYRGRTLNGAFTLWLRRPLLTNDSGQFTDDTDNSRAILTAEGVAPYTIPSTTGALSTFVQSNQAVRVLEASVAIPPRKDCRGESGMQGAGSEGDNFNPCTPLGAGSLTGVFGAGSISTGAK